jgi:hypothetical protein
MKKILLIAVSLTVFSGFAFGQTKKIESLYTGLSAKDCKTIEQSSEEAGWYRGSCPGVGGYKLELLEGDIRQTINVIAPSKKKYELELWSVVSFAFSFTGEKAEWRVTRSGKTVVPQALIVRFNTSEDSSNPEKNTSRLVVVKITKTSACVTDIVEPMKNQNEKARELADASPNKPCLKDED